MQACEATNFGELHKIMNCAFPLKFKKTEEIFVYFQIWCGNHLHKYYRLKNN